VRAALIGVVLAGVSQALPARAAPPAGAASPAPSVALALAERQVVTLEFDRSVDRVSLTDPDLLAVRKDGAKVEIGAQRGGRTLLEIAFEDGATLTYDVTVSPARRPAAAVPGAPTIALAVGEERRLRSSRVARVLVEENGVARVRVEGETIAIAGVSPGVTSVVLVDASGARTTWAVSVR
jgi:hypothetical protein